MFNTKGQQPPGSASGVPPSKPWQPMTRRVPNPRAQAIAIQVGDPFHEVWANDIYDCQVRYLENDHSGALHLSIKRFDRMIVRDWRHLQSIKNEIAGSEREAVELFPAESRLVDGANQTHLWVFPIGQAVPLGFTERAVGTYEQMVAELQKRGIDPGRANQRPWQPGLSTGPGYRPYP